MRISVLPPASAVAPVSDVTATAADVLASKVIVTKDGTVTAGTMTNNGAISETIGLNKSSFTIPKGYHNGSGKVSLSSDIEEALAAI